MEQSWNLINEREIEFNWCVRWQKWYDDDDAMATDENKESTWDRKRHTKDPWRPSDGPANYSHFFVYFNPLENASRFSPDFRQMRVEGICQKDIKKKKENLRHNVIDSEVIKHLR